MFNKIIVASLVLATNTVFAGDPYLHPKKQAVYIDKDKAISGCTMHEFVSAPYVGLSVGVRNNFTGGGSSVPSITNSTPAVYQGVEGILSGGYALTFNQRWYLAGEIYGADSARAKNLPRPSGFGVQSTWVYGIDVIPGVILTDDFLAYLRVGAVGTEFNHPRVNKGGWQLGAGGQVNLVRNWDLRAEYIFSSYTSVSPALSKIGANQFNVGVVYKFA